MLRLKSRREKMKNTNSFITHKNTIEQLSLKSNEPGWFLEYRMEALKAADELEPPQIERLDYTSWNLWEIPNVQIEDLSKDEIQNQIQSSSTEDIMILDFKQILKEQEELFKKIYNKTTFTQFKDLFSAFTMAFLTDGLFVYIPKNLQVKEPLELSFIQNNKTENTVNRQVLIYAEPHSSVEIIEKYSSIENDQEASANIHVEVIAEVGAKIQYSSLDQFGEKTNAFIQRIGQTGKDAEINWALGAMNDGNVVEDVRVNLEGQGSVSDVKTVAITHDHQVQGINVNVTNIGKNTIGNIFQHGVALDASTLTFNGIGHILKNSKNSDAQQESRVLMLSDEARADANPILLIDEYEVQAGHAASISRVDEEQLYYLMSRGLEGKQAEKLIIRGFLGNVLSEISIREVRQELIDTIERKLAQYDN